jgi:uncharacterized protein (DUF1778 family)
LPNARRKIVPIRLTEGEYDLLMDAAERKGTGITVFVREAALRSARRIKGRES